MGTQNYGLIEDLDVLRQFIDRVLHGQDSIGLDCETGYLGPDKAKASVRPETAILVGISFTNDPSWARYVPLNHDGGTNLDNRLAARQFWRLVSTGRVVAHNVNFERRHLSRWFMRYLADDPEYGAAVRASNGYFPIRSCTQVEGYLAAELQSFGLKSMTRIMYDRAGRLVPATEWNQRAKTLTEIAKLTADDLDEPDEDDDEDITQRQRKARTKARLVAEKQRREDEFDGYQMTELYELFDDLPVNRRRFLRFNVLNQHEIRVRDYACEDAAMCLAIHRHYYEQVRKTVLYPVEMAIVQECLPDMEDFGVRYDWPAMARAAEELRLFRDKYNAEIMHELSDMLGEPIAVDLGSPKQVGELLFGRLGYRTTVYTAGTRNKVASERKMSTGKVALASLAKKHPIVQKIRDWKQQTRLLGTYLEKYEGLYQWADDGMTHPSHLNAFVITGRFAVSEPAYQQSPKAYHYDLAEAVQAHAEDREPPPGTCFTFNFRDMIICPDDHYLLGFDLSQAELRAVAGYAQEPTLLQAFADGQDVHTTTAALMFGVPVDQVTPKMRDQGKTINFALLYGMSPKGLADRLGLPVDEAEELFERYFSALMQIKLWVDKQIEFGRNNGFVVSKYGRRLPIWEYQSDKRYIQQKGDRACVNYPVQGCLPFDTCVLTRTGWVPIGLFEDGEDVWTGAEWAPATRHAMGYAPRVRLHLSDGRTFDCDDRHRLLVQGEPWPEWKLVTEAKGLPLCRDHETDWGVPDDSTIEDWYWVGRFVGDGSLHTSNQGHTRWCMAFHGIKEADDIERFKAWLGTRFKGGTCSKYGYSVDDGPLRRGTGKGVTVRGGTKLGVEFWTAHGIVAGTKAKDLRVPPIVFTLDRARREAFCEGYLDADGNAKYDGSHTYWSKLTSASRKCLEDMLRLFQTIDRTGRIGGPVVLKGRGAGGSDYVFYDLWLARSEKQRLTIADIEYFAPEPMYTLSVDHPRHAFSSEGLISKNSATGDYMRIAMVRAVRKLKKAGLYDRVRLVMNVHDALEFYVHRSLLPAQVIEVLQPAVIFPVPGWPIMKADWHFGRRWGSVIPLGEDGLPVQREQELKPGIEEDEDGDPIEIMPDVDLDSLRPRPRTLVVRLTAMPTAAGYQRFLHLHTNTPGRTPVIVRTNDGEVQLDGTSGLTETHLGEISRLLGPVTLSWHDEQGLNARLSSVRV